ncbi:DUF6629 family protein [Streptomyces sp. NPDC088135]|uniref:DUF6629 family protein n=1 Tax=Streptomyces sp. NPDC088135 TaxID=3160993 RepID=UPI003424A007
MLGGSGCWPPPVPPSALWRLESVSTWCAFAAVCSVVPLARRPESVTVQVCRADRRGRRAG